MSVRLFPSNAVFLHIPKTDGSWVEYSLPKLGIETEPEPTMDGVTYRHAPLAMLKQRPPFVFTFVRHPLAWYESWWKFQAGNWTIHEPGVWHPQRCLEKCASDDFSEFIRLCIRLEPSYVSRMYEWFIGPAGFDHVDFIGRHEQLGSDLVHVLSRLGQTVDLETVTQLPRENVSQRAFGDPVWDPELKRQILELESPAIRRFYPH